MADTIMGVGLVVLCILILVIMVYLEILFGTNDPWG